MFYNFILSMWVMRKVDETYLTIAVSKGRITETEKQMILATPQNPIPEEVAI